MNDINHKYGADQYNIVTWNCNHFTDEASEFILGKGIPKHVLNQAKELLETPMGQQFKPLL